MMMICFSAFYEPHFRLKYRFHLHPTRFLFWSLVCRRTCDAIHVACDEASTLILAFLHHALAAAVFGVRFFQFQLFYQLCLQIKNWLNGRTLYEICVIHCLFNNSCIFFFNFSLGLLIVGPPTVDRDNPI